MHRLEIELDGGIGYTITLHYQFVKTVDMDRISYWFYENTGDDTFECVTVVLHRYTKSWT